MIPPHSAPGYGTVLTRAGSGALLRRGQVWPQSVPPGPAGQVAVPMSPTTPAPAGNRLLARLPPADYRRLLPLLQEVPLKFKQVLYPARSAIRHAYFPTRGLV